MMLSYRNSLFNGIVVGVILCVLEGIISCLPFLNISSDEFLMLFIAIEIVGIAIVVYSVSRYRMSVRMSVFHSTIVILSLLAMIVFNGQFGTVRFLRRILRLSEHSGTENISGLITLTFIATVIGAGLITIVVTTIKRWKRRPKS